MRAENNVDRWAVSGTQTKQQSLEVLPAVPDLIVNDEIHIVVDLRRDDPQVDVEGRPFLTDRASLIAAPSLKLGIKRIIDVVGAVVAIFLLSPVFISATAAVKLSSRGPVFFGQRRTGKDGVEFTFYKFRSMRVNADAERDQLLELNEIDGPVFKIREDPRLTKVGRFLRRTSIDELPQLWNVITGEMTLVGPRPLPTEEAAMCTRWESQRIKVKPGITGIWQVSGRSDLDFETWVRMDLEYIEHWSLGMDLVLLMKTVPAVLSGRGAY
jgi:lipopolysaccharide/colanic/teichoic acid biosynthesis glycosyltransferase